MSCNEWKEYALKDLIDIKHGYAFKGKFFSEEETNLILLTPGNFKIGGGFQAKKLKYYSKDGEVPEQYILRENDILVTMTDLSKSGDTLGYPIKVPVLENKILLHNQRLGKVEIKSDKIDKDFLYYLMCSNKYRNEVLASATGTTVKHSAPDRILKFEFGLPSIEEQQKIANILSCLDDKIELNNEMNKTLEEMAQSLFKRWFVDFEFPNEDGEPYKSSGGEMVDSELGMIPKGWEVQCIGDIGNVITGKTPSAKVEGSYGYECNFITPRDITDSPIILNTERKLSSIGINNLKKNLVCKNSIGVSCIGSNLGEVYITGENSITNQQINTVVLKEGKIYPYVYIYLKNMKEEFLNMAGGSAVPIINKTSFSGINILMPDMYILNKFVQSTTCYFERIEENLKENESLIALRDNLLPKLMSGEIDLSK